MERKLKTYVENLKRLSSDELHRSIEEIAQRERRHTVCVIVHLVEIKRRNLHLERGYTSLFEYCVRDLRLSEGSVHCRIQVANVALRFPQVLEALAKGDITLSVAALLSPHLSKENVETLLADSLGKTKREVEAYLTRLAPRPRVNPGIRKRPRSSEEKRGEDEGRVQDGPRSATARSERDLLSSSFPPPLQQSETPRGEVEPVQPEVYNFRFVAQETFKKKLERLAEVLGIENPSRNMAKVLESVVDLALEKKDPKKKKERREKREAARVTPRPEDVAAKAVDFSDSTKKRARYLPAADREEVPELAAYQCQYVAPDGHRCRERTGLQIDHTEPYAKGGTHEQDNLRALCPRHNLYLAKREFGCEFVEAKIHERRQVFS